MKSIVILLQVFTSSGNTTKLETSLFSILQFIFSVIFAWLFTKLSTNAEFIESQKKFAFAAYRRINEIDRVVKRIIKRVREQKCNISKETCQELDVIHEISLGISDSIQSSIEDWSDIIGEEIQTLNQIKTLESQRSDVLSENINEQKRISNLEKEIQKLTDSLPKSLKALARNTEDDDEKICKEVLNDRYSTLGYLNLRGFWDESFESKISDCSVGDFLIVKTGDAKSRIGAMLAYNKSTSKSVGVITNQLPVSYPKFESILFHFLRKSTFEAEIISIEAEKSLPRRQYFELKVTIPQNSIDTK